MVIVDTKTTKERWLTDLEGEAENFFWEGIEKMSTNKYWQNMKKCLIAGKENIPLQCRIGETCFTLIYIIGGKIYSYHPKNMNCVHKYSKDLMSVIITPVKNSRGGNTFFMMD